MERSKANARHTFGDDYARQTTTTIERINANPRHIIRDVYACQTTATCERIIVNTRHTVGDTKACICFSRSISYKCSSVFIVQNTVCRLIIFIVFVHSYTHQATATTERPIANTRHTVGDRNARQTTAATECTKANARHLVAVDICGDHDVQIGAGAQARDGAGGSICIHAVGKAGGAGLRLGLGLGINSALGDHDAGGQRLNGSAVHIGHTVEVALVALDGIRTDPTGEGRVATLIRKHNQHLSGDHNAIGDDQDEVDTVQMVRAGYPIQRSTGNRGIVIGIPVPDLNSPGVDTVAEGSHPVNGKTSQRGGTNIEPHTVYPSAD